MFLKSYHAVDKKFKIDKKLFARSSLTLMKYTSVEVILKSSFKVINLRFKEIQHFNLKLKFIIFRKAIWSCNWTIVLSVVNFRLHFELKKKCKRGIKRDEMTK